MKASATYQDLPAVRQSLLAGKGLDGHRYELVFLLDDRCALTRDGKVIDLWDDSGDGVDQAVAAMLRHVPHTPAAALAHADQQN